MYKLLVGSLLRSTSEDDSSGPLLFRPFFTQSGKVMKLSTTWKLRRAEIEVLAKRAEEKTERARRVPCIHDTTVCRGWLPFFPRLSLRGYQRCSAQHYASTALLELA